MEQPFDFAILATKQYTKDESITVLEEMKVKMSKLSLDKDNVYYRLLHQCEAELGIRRQKYLGYCPDTKKMFCAACMLYGKSGKFALTTTVYVLRDFTTTSKALRQHESSGNHRAACSLLIGHRQSPSPITEQKLPVDPAFRLLNEHLFEIVNDTEADADFRHQFGRSDIEKNRHVVQRVILCVLFLLANGMFIIKYMCARNHVDIFPITPTKLKLF